MFLSNFGRALFVLFMICLIFTFSVAIATAQTINLSGKPGLQAAYDPQRDLLYIPLIDTNRIAVVDMDTQVQTHTILGTNGGPIGIDINSAATRIAVTNETAQTIQLFDLNTESVIDSYDFSFITDHQPGELAILASGNILFGFQNNGSGGLSFKKVSAWNPSEGTLTTFGPSLQEPHYIGRSYGRHTVVTLESNMNPAWGIAYDENLTEICRNQNIPTDYSGSVPPHPGYNITAVNEIGTRIFAGKNVYNHNFQLITTLPEYSEPIFLSDGTILALSNDTGSNFTSFTKMNAGTGSVISTGLLPEPVSDLPDVFLVLASPPPPIPLAKARNYFPPGLNRICAVDRANNKVVVFTVQVEPPASVNMPWDMLE